MNRTSDRTPDRTRTRTSDAESNERTNERTDRSVSKTCIDPLLAERASAAEQGIAGFDELRAPLGVRHPVIRWGDRALIPPHVRYAVWVRDHGKCAWCGHGVEGVWHLDHITPWSAGGPDDTTNLRVMCERHNMERGNAFDLTASPRTPATWWCVRCYSNEGFPWTYANDLPYCHQHRVDVGYSGRTRCAVIKGYRRWYELHGEFPTWHKVEPINEEAERLVTAFCVHCYAPALTSRPL